MSLQKPYFIGIGGGTGSGKTTIVNAIKDEVDGEVVTTISLDNYYRERNDLSLEERQNINYDHPNAFEWDLLHKHLERLRDGEGVEMPLYDFTVHNRKGETQKVESSDIIINEGIFALYDEDIRDLLDLKIYMDTEDDVRILRRIERDLEERGRTFESVKNQYLSTVKPMHDEFVEPTKKYADIIIPEGFNNAAVDVLRCKIEDLVS
ncbi:MAG: uridine kinase [Candidatus Aenigmatarchaeota archaeon]